MKLTQKHYLFLLRFSLGWILFYAGITKVVDPTWSAASFIGSTKTFPEIYQLFLHPTILPAINLLNSWGVMLLGVSLISGILVRFSAPLGALLMILYYFPTLNFPYAGEHSFLIDEHIIYSLVLLLIYRSNKNNNF